MAYPNPLPEDSIYEDTSKIDEAPPDAIRTLAKDLAQNCNDLPLYSRLADRLGYTNGEVSDMETEAERLHKTPGTILLNNWRKKPGVTIRFLRMHLYNLGQSTILDRFDENLNRPFDLSVHIQEKCVNKMVELDKFSVCVTGRATLREALETELGNRSHDMKTLRLLNHNEPPRWPELPAYKKRAGEVVLEKVRAKSDWQPKRRQEDRHGVVTWHQADNLLGLPGEDGGRSCPLEETKRLLCCTETQPRSEENTMMPIPVDDSSEELGACGPLRRSSEDNQSTSYLSSDDGESSLEKSIRGTHL